MNTLPGIVRAGDSLSIDPLRFSPCNPNCPFVTHTNKYSSFTVVSWLGLFVATCLSPSLSLSLSLSVCLSLSLFNLSLSQTKNASSRGRLVDLALAKLIELTWGRGVFFMSLFAMVPRKNSHARARTGVCVDHHGRTGGP